MIPWTTAGKASLSITNPQSLVKLLSIESVAPSNHLILCCPLLSPSIFPSIRVFSNESVLHIRWPKYWSFSFSMSPSNENTGLISFRMDWLDLLAVQGTLKSLLQPHSLKASVLWHSAFFMVQYFSRPFMRKVCAGQGAVYSHVSCPMGRTEVGRSPFHLHEERTRCCPQVREHQEVPVGAGWGTWAKDCFLGDVAAPTSHPSNGSTVKDRTVTIKRFTGGG